MPPNDAKPATPGADTVLERLLAGNGRYAAGTANARDFALDRAVLAEGQSPVAIVLSCADSRVVPELLFDQSRGQLFVVRVAGNFVNEHNLASIEFGVAVLGAPLVVVLGHSGCGALQAAIDVVTIGAELPGHLPELVAAVRPAVEAVRHEDGDLLANAIAANVRINVERLRTAEPVVATAVATGRVRVVGAVYDIRTGRVRLVA